MTGHNTTGKKTIRSAPAWPKPVGWFDDQIIESNDHIAHPINKRKILELQIGVSVRQVDGSLIMLYTNRNHVAIVVGYSAIGKQNRNKQANHVCSLSPIGSRVYP